jgi:hypothetical protein
VPPAVSQKWMMLVNLFDIAAMNVSGIIGRNTTESVKNGPLNYVTKFYSSNLKAAILVTARFVFCRYRWSQENQV